MALYNTFMYELSIRKNSFLDLLFEKQESGPFKGMKIIKLQQR